MIEEERAVKGYSHFTWERYMNVEYVAGKLVPVVPGSEEETYFRRPLCETVASALHRSYDDRSRAVQSIFKALIDVAEKNELEVVAVNCSQIIPLPMRAIDNAMRPSPRNETQYVNDTPNLQFYVGSDGKKQYVHIPKCLDGSGQRHGKLSGRPWLCYILAIPLYRPLLDANGNTIAHDSSGQTSPDPNCLPRYALRVMHQNGRCGGGLLVELGEMIDTMFSAWPVSCHINVKRSWLCLWQPSLWPCVRRDKRKSNTTTSQAESRATEQEDASVESARSTSGGRTRYENIDGKFTKISYVGRGENVEEVSTVLCNFMICELVALYKPSDPSQVAQSMQCIEVAKLTPDAPCQEVYYHKPGQTNPPSNRYSDWRGRVFLTISAYRYVTDLYRAFQVVDPYLFCCELKLTDMLLWIQRRTEELGGRLQQHTLMSHYGKQIFICNSRVFAASNCVQLLRYENGHYTVYFGKHSEFSLAYLPETFDNTVNVTYIPIKQLWVRYAVFHELWNTLLPYVFGNNLMPAKQSIVFAVMSMYWDDLVKGKDNAQPGFPIAKLFSEEHGTGKTNALSIISWLNGYGRKAVAAGDATKAKLIDLMNYYSNMTITVDDVIHADNIKGSTSYDDVVRMVYDNMPRQNTRVSGVSNKGSMAITVKFLPRHTPLAVVTRPALIQFTS